MRMYQASFWLNTLKLYFIERGDLNEKMLFYIFDLFFHVESPVATVKEEIGRYVKNTRKEQQHIQTSWLLKRAKLVERRLKRKHPTHLTKEIK